MFLEQYWGGPTTYSEQRGHPRLRMRHRPFRVTPAQRDRWLTHMMAAVDTLDAAARQRPAPARLPRARRPLDGQLLPGLTRTGGSARRATSCSSRKTLQKWTSSTARRSGGACVPVTDVSTLRCPDRRARVILAGAPVHTADADPAWWRHAVIYQIYPRSWADGNGDGIGDLARHHRPPALPARPRRRRRLALALLHARRRPTPATTSPTTATSTRSSAPSPTPTPCSRRAHELGFKVIVDLVPNHSSDEHEWFQAALAAGPGSPERARYMFRDG